jgi:hypothetical protein
VYVTLTKQEHIQLVMEVNSWKTQHQGEFVLSANSY